MAKATSTTLFLPDDPATLRLGETLAGSLVPGDIVLLQGDLGAGKTALARAVIRALVADPMLEVPSPSFALVQPYAGPRGPILHADLYRLAAAGEIAELGLFDDPAAIVLVEWPERAPELFDDATVIVHLSVPPGGAGRDVVIESDRKLNHELS
jgi:tRNA threonylcarbamoyladenosine biosynthesis protein TsaE